MTRTLDVDYLVVGAGAMGMGFVDTLVDHSPSARVAVMMRSERTSTPIARILRFNRDRWHARRVTENFVS